MRLLTPLLVTSLTALLLACGADEPIGPERYAGSDALVTTMKANVSAADSLTEVIDIDHSRLGSEVGSTMPPARVLIFSEPQLESELIAISPLLALDLPLRALAYESAPGAGSSVSYNSFDYLVSRYQLDAVQTANLRAAYDGAMSAAIGDIDRKNLTAFADDSMQPDGIITINSPYDFAETLARVNAAIDSQGDTVRFGSVDFQANAKSLGIDLPHSHMILFGGPGPGGKAMADAVTLGLDGFCQKFLIWEDSNGQINLSFNDLLALADRQEVPKRLALRVINYRLNSVFSEALSGQ
ncbi:MAG: DUF302 domain-containing protein [Halioglobus sp.]